MTPEEYHSALESVVVELRKHGLNAECRGTGMAEFVYAERGSRAVELSGLLPGVFVELFDGEAVPQCRDHRTFQDATADVLTWLSDKT